MTFTLETSDVGVDLVVRGDWSDEARDALMKRDAPTGWCSTTRAGSENVTWGS
jgi:hypothetical protein